MECPIIIQPTFLQMEFPISTMKVLFYDGYFIDIIDIDCRQYRYHIYIYIYMEIS